MTCESSPSTNTFFDFGHDLSPQKPYHSDITDFDVSWGMRGPTKDASHHQDPYHLPTLICHS